MDVMRNGVVHFVQLVQLALSGTVLLRGDSEEFVAP